MHRHRQSIILAGALLALLSCNSPLDVPTKRIDTQLTNRIKVRDVEVNARIDLPSDSMSIYNWSHTVATAIFTADTLGNPPHIWMDYQMQGIPSGDTASTVMLKSISLKLDDVKADGALPLEAGPGSGSRASAIIVVDGREYVTTATDNASGTFYYLKRDKESIQGTIVIGMNRSPVFTILIAINFTATQD